MHLKIYNHLCCWCQDLCCFEFLILVSLYRFFFLIRPPLFQFYTSSVLSYFSLLCLVICVRFPSYPGCVLSLAPVPFSLSFSSYLQPISEQPSVPCSVIKLHSLSSTYCWFLLLNPFFSDLPYQLFFLVFVSFVLLWLPVILFFVSSLFSIFIKTSTLLAVSTLLHVGPPLPQHIMTVGV